jgi:hypothetical protein
MAKTVYDVLIDRYTELKKDKEGALCEGVAKDFAEYRELCGAIQGLATAIREVQDLMRSQVNDND